MAELMDGRMKRVLEALGENRVTTALAVAESLKISERSVYRYIVRLRAAGQEILADPGVGYMVKRPTYIGVDLAGGPDITCHAVNEGDGWKLTSIALETMETAHG